MRGLPVLIRASHYPAIDVQAFPRAVLATGETTDSFCGCANPWRHRDADTRRCADGARSRSRQLGVRPPPKPFWRAPADCFWLSASRAPPAGLIRGNKKPGAMAGFRLSLLDTRRNDRMGLISLIRSLMSTGNHAACSISKPSPPRMSAACARASFTRSSAALPIS